MSNEMIERVAKAILVNIYDADWDYCKSIPFHPIYTRSFEFARAAIAAMREPTEAMIEATDPVDRNEWQYALETWQSMIDEVLK